MSYRLLAAAQRDVQRYFNRVAADSPSAAERFLDSLDTALTRLASREFEGQEALLGARRVRTWPLPPLRIYYRRRRRSLEVIRVYHQSRRPIAK